MTDPKGVCCVMTDPKGVCCVMTDPKGVCCVMTDPKGVCCVMTDPKSVCCVMTDPKSVCCVMTDPKSVCYVMTDPKDACCVVTDPKGTCCVVTNPNVAWFAGCDRHLFGLAMVAREEGLPMPQLFQHPAYVRRYLSQLSSFILAFHTKLCLSVFYGYRRQAGMVFLCGYTETCRLVCQSHGSILIKSKSINSYNKKVKGSFGH